MLSSLRNYTNNLQYSQKFYYGNYEYYNDYQNIEKDYKEDLSKVHFKCKRKSKGRISIYRYINPQESHLKHLYLRRLLNRQQEVKGYRTMEQLLYPFVNIYFENNYKVSRPIRQENLEGLQIMYHPGYQVQQNSTLNQYFMDFLQHLKNVNDEIVNLISQQSNYTNLEMNYKIEWYQFLRYFNQILNRVILEKTTQSQTFGSVYEFSQLIFNCLEEMIRGKRWNSLILAQPNCSNISKVIHPLLFGINMFVRSTEKCKNNPINVFNEPKIVFINLDGIESPSNIRAIKQIAGSILYVSIYKQPSILQLNNGQLQNHLYKDICQIYSEMMIREIGNNDQRMFIFPMNSHYLRKQYYKNKIKNKQKLKGFPTVNNSQDIMFLFESFIYEEIRNFNPTMILLSYNGVLDIKQDYFVDIVRNMSVIGDHKVLLFSNLTHLFQPLAANGDVQVDRSEYQHYDEFLLKYIPYQFHGVRSSTRQGNGYRINTQRFYNNIGMFMKVSSGCYSMQERCMDWPLSKYSMSHRYMYLEMLGMNAQFEYVNKYILNKWRSDEIGDLYGKYGRWELKENKKHNEYYQKVIDESVRKLINADERSKMDRVMFYRLKEIEAYMMDNYQNGLEMDSGRLLECYMEEQKEKLLLENLQNHKTKKAYYLSQSFEDQQASVVCVKFQIRKNENKEDIYFEKYTQVFFEENGYNVIVVNYRDENDRHLVLSGKIQQGKQIIEVSQVTESIPKQEKKMQQQLEKSKIDVNEEQNNKKRNLVYINYTHFFLGKNLYLFWPQQFDIEEEVKHKLLKLEYKPLSVNKFIKVNIQSKMGEQSQYQQLIFKNDQRIEVPPRYGCSVWGEDHKKFFIFGGINQDYRDFTESNTGISIATVSYSMSNGIIKIQNLPKKEVKSMNRYKNHKQFENLKYAQVRLRPKINYKIEINPNNNKQLIIYGGFGRETTGFYNMFSYEKYIFNYQDKILTYMDSERRLVNLMRPIQINTIGKYPISKDENPNQIEEKFSDQLKDKFLFETGYQKQQQHGSIKEVKQIISFIDENYRVNDFKSDHKKIYLFGFNRNVREKIYTKFWSPELYIEDRQRTWIVNITLKLDKIQQFANNANQIIPREDDLISVCLVQDRLYILSISSIFQLQNNSQPKVILYTGDLVNMNEILRKNEIIMNEAYKFQFSDSIKYLITKTIFVIDQKIFLFGGLPRKKYGYREDYILQQKSKNKYKLKIRKVESYQQNPDSLELQYPFVIKQQNLFLLYSIALESGNNTKSKWKLKMESFTQQYKVVQSVLTSQLFVYYRSYNNPNPIRIIPQFKQPKFSIIVKYQKFNFDRLKQIIDKVIIRLNKKQNLNQQINKLKIIMNMPNQQPLRKQSQNCRQFFKGILDKAVPMIQAQKNQINLEDEDLIKDLKLCYSKINKLIIQDLVMLDYTNQNQYLFIIEDKSVSKKVKYLAIGSLGNSKLIFFKIRFKHEFMLCLNTDSDLGLFYHPTESDFQDIVEEKRFNIYKQNLQQKEQNTIKSIKITIKN